MRPHGPLTDKSVELSHCRTLVISCAQQRGWPLLERLDIVVVSSEACRPVSYWLSSTKNFVGIMPLVLQPSRSRFDVTLPLQVGILQSPLSIPFFNFIMDLLLGLHAFLTVSSFHDGPMASLGQDPPAIEQIVAIAPIACRDSGDDRCCLRFLKALTK